MKRKNGFTLIELLAIIVILAIIAVITVPIILGIIEDASKNAAKDSAYGFKDSVNKYYAQQLLTNQNLKLNDTYTVTNGTLSGGSFGDSNITSLPIQVSGKVPTSGTLTYSNNKLTSGCLVIGDYAVTFSGENVTNTTKGECSATIPSCPGCKFIFTTSLYGIMGSDYDGYSAMPTEDDGLTNDYTTLIGEGGHPYFLGLIESTSDSTKIGRAFACGIEKDSNDNDVPFCLEGYDPSKYSDDDNVGILNTIFPSCNASASDSYAYCDGSSVDADAYDDGGVVVAGDGGYCDVGNNGYVVCFE